MTKPSPGPWHWRRFLAGLFLPCLLVASVGPLHAQRRVEHEIPELTVLISPTDPVRTQQQIIQRIRLVSRYPFDTLRIHPGIPADSAVVSLEPPMTRPFESWGVEGYVHTTTRAIFPQHSGGLEIPPVTVTGAVTNDAGRRLNFEEQSAPVSYRVLPIAQEIGDEPWLVASEVKLTESWSTPPAQLRVGQIAQRTITQHIHGALAEHLSALTMPVGSGTQILSGKITRSNNMTPNGVIASLEQVFDVKVASERLSDISPVHLAWWHADENRLMRSSVRGWRIEPIMPNPDALIATLIAEARLQQSRSRTTLVLMLIPAGLLALALVVIWRRRRQLISSGRRWREQVALTLLGEATELPAIGFSRVLSQRSEDQS